MIYDFARFFDAEKNSKVKLQALYFRNQLMAPTRLPKVDAQRKPLFNLLIQKNRVTLSGQAIAEESGDRH